ncbi:MAG: hypothetical protein QN183_13840 [Armatimonadota bacterium]|nr:hypothetical protein [Armatimonadota bacterium]
MPWIPSARLRGVFAAPPRGTGLWAGTTTVPSGAVTRVVSTPVVESASIILLAAQAATNQASGFTRTFEVRSINPGVGFVVGTSDGVAVARDTTVMWLVWRAS